MSGALSVPFAAVGVFSQTTSARLLWFALAATAFVVANYRAWKETYDGNAMLRQELLKLEMELAARSSALRVNTLADALQVEFEVITDPNPVGAYIVHNAYAVLNNVGDGILNDCKAVAEIGEIIGDSPGDRDPSCRYALENATAFNVMPSIPKRILVAYYRQRIDPQSAIPETIGIATPHGHWALAIHSLNATRRYMVSLHIETIGKSLLKIPCWLQVKNNTLLLERI
jgi:hypothetical protein